MKQYNDLRKQYPVFYYHGYEAEETEQELVIRYQFEIEGLSSFEPTWRFPKPENSGCALAQEGKADALLEQMIYSLGLVELVSYWKITCSPRVVVEAGYLDEKQILWWKDLYFNGLGEFFYINHINADAESFMTIETTGNKVVIPAAAGGSRQGSGVMVPIGGGKDSVVTLELLRSAGEKCFGYIINPRGATVHTAEAAKLDASHVISAKRTLDKNMLELNKQGFLNGHTPFSAIVAFSSIIAARLYHLDYIALSNESSANESTVQGSTVNHQYSKSFKFEMDFHNYETEYLPGSALYFSLLRPLSEFQIAGYFAKCTAYHKIFRSCNAGSKTDSWCAHCPKCMFVYLILSPFLSREEVREIFGVDMLEDETMIPVMEQLVGIQEEKPFECVGSRDEVNTAIILTIEKLEQTGEKLPKLLEYYKNTRNYQQFKDAGDNYSSYFDTENLVPEKWLAVVKENCWKQEA